MYHWLQRRRWYSPRRKSSPPHLSKIIFSTFLRCGGKLKFTFDFSRSPTIIKSMTYLDRIEINPQKLAGKPVIKGTRLPVALILNLLARGYTIGRILRAYPNLKKTDILAAIRYSEARLQREIIRPFELVR